MTVAELIEKLKEMPQENEVWAFVDDEYAKVNDVYCTSTKLCVGCEHKIKKY